HRRRGRRLLALGRLLLEVVLVGGVRTQELGQGEVRLGRVRARRDRLLVERDRLHLLRLELRRRRRLPAARQRRRRRRRRGQRRRLGLLRPDAALVVERVGILGRLLERGQGRVELARFQQRLAFPHGARQAPLAG